MASSSLQPQQFGSWLHEPFLARAAEPGAELGRHALGAFLTLRLADRFRPEEEPSHPLALAYQIRATRDYLLDLHPQNPEAAHLLEVVRLAEAVQKGSVRSMLEPPLGAYAFWLEDELRLEEALDVVETALGLTGASATTEEIAALLQRGRILRKLGQLSDAAASYEAARTKATVAGDSHSVRLSRIGEAIIMKQLGNLPGSERALRGILQDAREAGDIEAQARAHHDLGAVLVHMEQTPQAIEHLYQAFELYERPAQKYRALSDLGEGLRRQGRLAAARDAFTVVLRHGKTEELRASAMIALLELSAQMRDRVGFTGWKRQIGAIAGELPADRQVLFHLQLGLGCAGFGQMRAAERALHKAAAIAEQHELNEYAFQVEAALAALKKTSAPNVVEDVAAVEAENSEELAEIAGKLQVLSAGY